MDGTVLHTHHFHPWIVASVPKFTRGLCDSEPSRCEGRSPKFRAGSLSRVLEQDPRLLAASHPSGEGVHNLVGGPEAITSAIASRRSAVEHEVGDAGRLPGFVPLEHLGLRAE